MRTNDAFVFESSKGCRYVSFAGMRSSVHYYRFTLAMGVDRYLTRRMLVCLYTDYELDTRSPASIPSSWYDLQVRKMILTCA